MRKNIFAVLCILIAICGVSIYFVRADEASDKRLENEAETIENAKASLTEAAKLAELDQIFENDEIKDGDLMTTYEIADGSEIDIYKVLEYKTCKEAENEKGVKAYIQRKEDSCWHELILETEDNIEKIDLSNISFFEALNIKWLDDDTVAAECHCNPSLNVLLVYNKETGLNKYYGLYFEFDADNNLFYATKSPHWSPEKVAETLVDSEGNVLFTTAQEDYMAYDIGVNEKYIAFYVLSGEQATLYVLNRADNSTVLVIDSPCIGRIEIK